MKNLSSLLLLTILSSSLSAFAFNSDDMFRERQFRLLCQSSLAFLEQASPLIISGRTIDLGAMKSALQNVRIEWTDKKLEVNGSAVDAINTPSQNLITLNRSSWDHIEQFSKTQLCLHELWGLTFHDHQDDRYLFSSQMVNNLRFSVLKNSLLLVQCAPSVPKTGAIISVSVATELFILFNVNVLKGDSKAELAGFGQWVDEEGKFTRKSSAFVTTNEDGILVERFSSPLNANYEQLLVPKYSTKNSMKQIYSEASKLLQQQNYQCVVTI
jgi:hypothetical protein